VRKTLDPTASGHGEGITRTLGAAVRAGLWAGLFWGLGDGIAAGRGAGTTGLLTWAGCLSASVVVHSAVATAATVLAAPLAHPRLRGRSGGERFRWLLGLALGLALFLDAYWWSRPYVLWGVPATDPRRLAAAAGMLALGMLAGGLAARVLAPLARSRLAWGIAVAAWVGGLAYLAASRPSASQRGAITETNRAMPNVLLFVVDALRADVLGCYGNQRVRTPVIDGLARRGVVFERAIAQAPYTWTSFGSILTGKYPRRHGLLKMAPGVRMPENVTLAAHLKQEAGYTGATLMTGTLSHGSGLMAGFDAYYEALVGHPLVDTARPWSVFWSELVVAHVWTKLEQRRDPSSVATQAVRWLGDNAERRFVAMVHYYSTHTPYDPPERYRGMYLDPAYDGPIRAFYAGYREQIEAGEYAPTPADVAQIQNLYYAGVTWADDMIGAVLSELERRGVLDDTLVIVTSDHGEELGDHGLWEHNFMYQTNLRIPLVMSWPGRLPEGARVSALVESIDILPTVCELAGLEPPHDPELPADAGRVDGKSLVALARGEAAAVKEFAFSENGRYLSIQDPSWKLVVPADALDSERWTAMRAGEGERAQLYHLAEDPLELENAFDEHPGEAERLVAELRRWSESLPRGREVFVPSDRDRDFEQRLRELGYTGDGIGHARPAPPGGATGGDEDRARGVAGARERQVEARRGRLGAEEQAEPAEPADREE
jgi:arylsulfatase A-like enzyme